MIGSLQKHFCNRKSILEVIGEKVSIAENK